MSFFDDIKTAVLALEPTATVLFDSLVRHENESFNYSSFPVVVVESGFNETSAKTGAGFIRTARQLTIDFLDSDTWDNRNNDNNDEQTEESSLDIILRMSTLANSVLWRFLETSDLTGGANENITFTKIPVYRSTSNNMTGVKIAFSYQYQDTITCA